MRLSNCITAAALFVLVCSRCVCATITADSTSYADVNTAITAASDGDTVIIPAGESDWSTSLKITKAITLQGAGKASTILADSMGTSGGWGDKALIHITPVSGKTTRITGIGFVDGSGTKSGTADGGLILVDGTYSITATERVIIDNCDFDEVDQDSGIIRVSGTFGLTHNCSFTRVSGFTHIFSHGNDASWADPTHLGTDKFWVVEDCTDTKTGALYESVDSDRGARWVWRYNTATNARLGMHGADSGTFQRGTRAYEVYENAFSGDNSTSALLLVRSGTGVIYNNTLTSWGAGNLPIVLSAYRATDDPAFSWGQADGFNGWDENDAGNPLVTGTATGAGTLTVTDSGASWDTDEWVGYIVRNSTTELASMISANTATTITFLDDIGYTTAALSFSVGNGYQINRVTKILDMPGLGVGDLVDSSGDPTSPDSAVEPIYYWGNTVNGNAGGLASETPLLASGTHYASGERPAYSPLRYPHPLRGLTRRATATTANVGTINGE